MTETTRRRFLLGLSATGALAALPLPAVAEFATSVEEVVGSRLPAFGWAAIRVVGPITSMTEPAEGHVPIEPREFFHEMRRGPEIDVTDHKSTARSFTVGLPEPAKFRVKAYLAPEVVDACEGARVLKTAIVLPKEKTAPWLRTAYSFECLVTNVFIDPTGGVTAL